MTDLSHIEGLKQGEQMYVVEILRRKAMDGGGSGTVLKRSIPLTRKGAEEMERRFLKAYDDIDTRIVEAPKTYLCPHCSFPLDKVWKDAKQTEVDHLSCRNDDCRWSSKDRLQHPRKREEGTGRKSATWGT